MDGRWLTALTLGALVVVPRAIGGFNRKTKVSRRSARQSEHPRVSEPLPPVRDLLRAVERRDRAFEQLVPKIPVLR